MGGKFRKSNEESHFGGLGCAKSMPTRHGGLHYVASTRAIEGELTRLQSRQGEKENFHIVLQPIAASRCLPSAPADIVGIIGLRHSITATRCATRSIRSCLEPSSF